MKTVEFEYFEKARELFVPLSGPGAFLVVNDAEGNPNVMTIGWGTVGVMWYKPVLNIMVRTVRHTHQLLEKNINFTVCVPKENEFKKALSFCGSKSGRDTNKVRECGLSTEPGRVENTTIIAGCHLFYECTVIHKNSILPQNLVTDIKNTYYSDIDFHTVFSGEIIHSYMAVDAEAGFGSSKNKLQ
jgi:flavin reductase (DIM6/NTAB) family NADH-FMN oxidoreductase RutF